MVDVKCGIHDSGPVSHIQTCHTIDIVSLQAAMEPYHLRMYSIQWNNILTWSWNHGTDQTSVQASGPTRFSSGLVKWSTHISRFLQLVHPTEELGEPL